MFLAWMSSLAAAERPLTYAEALRGATANNGTLLGATYLRDQAEASVLAARGVFDPLYSASAWTTRSRQRGVAQGFPFEQDSETWQLGTGLTGVTGTGTSYDLGLSVAHDVRDFSSQSVVQLDPDCVGEDCDVTVVPFQRLTDFYNADLSVSVTQQLLEGVRFRYNVQNVTLARAALTASELAVERERQNTLFSASTAYWTWVYHHQLHENAVQSVAVAEEALRVGRAQLERGQLAPVEVTRLEAALVQARATELETANLAQQSANLVLLTMGEDPSQVVVPATEAGDVPPVEIDPARAVEVALAQNLDLSVARQQLDMARIEAANAKHAVLPSLAATVGGGVRSQICGPNSDDAGPDCRSGNPVDAVGALFADDNQPFVTLGGELLVPLGNRASRGERERTEAVVMQREREVQDLERQVRAAVEEQVRALQSARQRMDLADANLLLAEQTLSAEEALANVGRSIQKDVLEARTALESARAEAAKARTDYRLAQAQLLALQGQLTEEGP